MPGNAVTVTATFRNVGGGDTNGGNDGDSGGNQGGNNQGNGRPTPTPTPEPPENVTIGNGDTEVAIEVKDKNVTVNLTEENIADIIESALKAEERTVVIDLSVLEDVVSATIPGEAWASFGEAELGLEIAMNTGTLTFDPDAVLNIAGIADGAPVTASIAPVEIDNLLPAQQRVVNQNDIVVRITLSVNDEYISQLGGQLAVTLPYEGELPVNAWRVTAEGTLELLNSVYDPKTSTVTFTTTRLSVFAVGFRPETTLVAPILPTYIMRLITDQVFVPIAYVAQLLTQL
jgi:hypothetical protein